MYRLTVSETFDAAHFLPDFDGPCGNLHGHTWRVEATWSYTTLGEDGLAEDFGKLKGRLRDLLPDHTCLNETLPFAPTAENIARWLCESLGAERVRVWESESASAEYTAGD